MSELKNCPFCGEQPLVFKQTGLIVCSYSMCGVNPESFSSEDWNNRTCDQSAEEIAQLKRDKEELRELLKLYKLTSDEVTKYKHALSYNEIYAGEPEGELKNNLAELDMVSCKAIQLLNK